MFLDKFKTDFPFVRKRLLDIRRAGRLGHAYLFVGDDIEILEGFGRAWIATACCQQPREDGDACGKCYPCTRFAAGYYPELYELRPTSKSRQILIETIREFERILSLTSAKGRPKAGLIIEADRLIDQAQNAFLKTLEEPPKGLLLVLVTTQAKKLLPTIRSRCQEVSLLRNRQTYDFAVGHGIVAQLDRLHRHAGAGVALAVSQALGQLFASLLQASEKTEPAIDEKNAHYADQADSFKKRMQEMREARVQSEYLRLREQITGAIDCWFLQRSLLAHGVAPDALPQPELVPSDLAAAQAYGVAAADNDVKEAAQFAAMLAANVDEALCRDVFCLQVCRKAD